MVNALEAAEKSLWASLQNVFCAHFRNNILTLQKKALILT